VRQAVSPASKFKISSKVGQAVSPASKFKISSKVGQAVSPASNSKFRQGGAGGFACL
jgi:hypothetical protein